ncbi:PEBP-like protein [Macrolepiota fuliginosa MF-IS2]|uniref:PEBP-like protein n=1 Tax=Macrolepiota fuliginosa MF-IS2 TaxID=1400762 RepID=A0A9P5X173_9AGAR|nr:PEBP-like protein [Macrolepiota fuliginosa MF-IS2]
MSLPSEILQALQAHSLIPDILPDTLLDTFKPTVLLTITWTPFNASTHLGNPIPLPSVLSEPDVHIKPLVIPLSTSGGVDDMRYTLVMTDPDAPSRAEPKYRQWRHWVVTGLQIPSAQSGETDQVYALKTKPATAPYRAPGPPPGSGSHRYTFLLFEEPKGGVTIPQGATEYGTTLEERRSWNALKFAEEYGLKLVGVNFFLCERD